MTPSARLQAAIDVLAVWFDGAPVEKALTNWARGARYAGSKDRAAVRDIVFDCLRRRMFFQNITSLPDSARGLVIAYAAHSDMPLSELFSDGGYGPEPLTPDEMQRATTPGDNFGPEFTLECPAWMVPEFERSVGAEAEVTVALMRSRAPVFLRVNTLKSDLGAAQGQLAAADIETSAHPLADTALEVLSNPRRIVASGPYRDGMVELQDAASQAVVAALPQEGGGKALKILDYCAGGGGKALALAARFNTRVVASDIDFGRMKDLPTRAQRAGAQIDVVPQAELDLNPPFDLVFVDAPCTGSGAWRRNPEGKWRLTPTRAEDIREQQRDVLEGAAKLVSQDGALAYVTCSIFRSENEEQVARFVAQNPSWRVQFERRFAPSDGGDGFYIAYLTRI